MAILKDHDMEPYTTSSSGFLLKYRVKMPASHFTSTGQSGSNILPSKQQPTTMIGLVVALKNQTLVQLLLDAEMNVHSDEATVPLLTIAMLHQNEGIVQALLTALLTLGGVRQWALFLIVHGASGSIPGWSRSVQCGLRHCKAQHSQWWAY